MIARPAKRCLAIAAAAMLSVQGFPVWVWAAGAEQAMLEGVEVQPNQVVLHLDKQVHYNPVLTREPPRLVIELLNTEYAAAGQTQAGEGDLLKRVRSGQYQKEPTLISRVVLDLKKMSAYQTKWDGTSLLVSLIGGATERPAVPASGAAKPTAAAPKPAVAAPKPAMPGASKTAGATAASAAAPAAKPVSTPAAAAAKPAPAATAAAKPVAAKPAPAPKPVVAAKPQAAAPEAKKEDVDPAGGGLSEAASTENSPELARLAGAEDVESQEEAAEDKPAKTKTPGIEFRRRVKKDILAGLPRDPITIDYDNTDIRDILKLMGMKARINIIYGADVAGAVTLHLQDVPFSEAFTTVLSMSGLVATQVGENILRVMTPAAMAKQQQVAVNQTRVIRLRYAKADEIKPAIDAVRSAENRQGKLTTDANTNSLIVTDTLEAIAGVERLLAELDVRPQQVLIEAKLVEVYLNKGLNLGIQWDYLGVDGAKIAGQQGTNMIGTAANPLDSSGKLIKPFDMNSKATVGDGSNGRGTGVFLPASSIAGAFTFGRVTNNYFLSATLTAAASSGKAKVLSDPKITALNGKTANIQIQTSIPYVTTDKTPNGATTTTSENVKFQQTGITLNVTPTINADGRITMLVNPTVSQPSNVPASAGTTGAIATDSRTAQTSVIVQDGGTVVIGGLITDSVSDTIRKVPLLGDIPLIGWLFKNKSTTRTRVELLIFVTAKIVPT